MLTCYCFFPHSFFILYFRLRNFYWPAFKFLIPFLAVLSLLKSLAWMCFLSATVCQAIPAFTPGKVHLSFCWVILVLGWEWWIIWVNPVRSWTVLLWLPLVLLGLQVPVAILGFSGSDMFARRFPPCLLYFIVLNSNQAGSVSMHVPVDPLPVSLGLMAAASSPHSVIILERNPTAVTPPG